MDIQKRFEEMLVPVSEKINEECQNFLPDSGDRIPPPTYIRSTFQLIKKELMETLEIITLINPSKTGWKAIRETGVDFIKEQSEMLQKEYCRRWSRAYFNEKEFEILVKEVTAEYHTFIDGQIMNLEKINKNIYTISSKVSLLPYWAVSLFTI